MAEAKRLSFDAGHRMSLIRTVTDQDVRDFARISGDSQGFHVDEAYAARSRFGKRIAHGTLIVGYVSAALGTLLPGADESVLFVSQEFKFPAPVFLGDTVTVALEVTKADHRRGLATLRAVCTSQTGTTVLRGEVMVMVDHFPYR